MKKQLLFLCLIATSLAGVAQVTNYNVGDVVDDFTVTDTEGNVHNLYSITSQGKYVFLDFFFVTCPPCQEWQPTFSQLHDKYGCNEGEVYCLSINNGNDNDAQVIAYEEMYGGPYNHAPAVSNEGGGNEVDANFGVVAYPTFCLINPNNEIVNTDIWPLTGIETFEAAFPAGFEPEPMECTTMGIVDFAGQLSISLYPNPVRSGSGLGVKLPSSQISQVSIFSVSGRELFQGTFEGNEFNLPVNLASGTYFLDIKGTLGSAQKTFVVE